MRIKTSCSWAVLVLLLFATPNVIAQNVLVDDFIGPNQSGLAGESRAAFPPGTSGGSVLDDVLGTEVALDRGLFGPSSALFVADGNLNFSIGPGFVEVDWDINGFDFVGNGVDRLFWRGLSNTGDDDIDLQLELFQTFNETDSVVGTGVVDITLLAGETRDVSFNTVGGPTDFAGFRVINQSAATFTGTLVSVGSVPEPSSTVFLAVVGLFTAQRRRRITI